MIEIFSAAQFCCNRNNTLLLDRCNSRIGKRRSVFKPSRLWGVTVVGWGGASAIKSILTMKAKMNGASTFTSEISTDIPLYEAPEASFDQYLEDKPRVFEAMFPEKLRSQQLNEDVWMVHMLPIDFLFASARPVIYMRLSCLSDGKDYPSGVSQDITKVIELEIIRWQLEGLDNLLQPSQFSLGVKGALYPDRRGLGSRLKGTLQMSISFVLPAVISLFPEDVIRNVADSALRRLIESMKDRVNSSLLSDYDNFKREKSIKLV